MSEPALPPAAADAPAAAPSAPPAAWGPLIVVAAVVLVGGAGLATALLSGPALPVLGAVPEFSFEERSGATVGRRELLGRIWIADFIFTNCAGTCPAMSHRMAEVHEALRGDDDALCVSFTTDPERDTLGVLRGYADHFKASPDRWLFLRGAQKEVLDLQFSGFRIGSATDPFLHSERFALVDRKGRIRGYYHGIEAAGVKALLEDLRRLRKAGGS